MTLTNDFGVFERRYHDSVVGSQLKENRSVGWCGTHTRFIEEDRGEHDSDWGALQREWDDIQREWDDIQRKWDDLEKLIVHRASFDMISSDEIRTIVSPEGLPRDDISGVWSGTHVRFS